VLLQATASATPRDPLNLYRFENGKVIEHRSAFDMLRFLQQIGAA
jgi:hypothetical protein